MGTYTYVAALGGTTPRPASRQQFSRTRPSTIIDMASKTLTEKGAMLDRALGGKEGVEDLYEVVRAFMDEESVDDFIKAGKLNSVYDSSSTDHAFACRLGTESSDQAYHDLNTYARALTSFYDRASREQCANLTLPSRGSLPPYIRPRRTDLRVNLHRQDVHHRAEV